MQKNTILFDVCDEIRICLRYRHDHGKRTVKFNVNYESQNLHQRASITHMNVFDPQNGANVGVVLLKLGKGLTNQ